ncbi:ribosylnicotinamide kinase [Thecaphora frezii]
MDSSSPLIVGVGGATCSGKTTLSKHLLRILSLASLPSFILHQDDFAPLESTLPIHATFNERDWDAPATAIDYARMRDTLRHIRQTGELPPGFSSHDHLNQQPECSIPRQQQQRWARALSAVGSAQKVVLADGFLLYYDTDVRSEMDVKLLLRVPRDTLKQRRQQRAGYATAEGTVWQDPPGYFDAVVWPAYVEAHQNVFDGPLDSALPATLPSAHAKEERGGPIPNLVLLEPIHPIPQPLQSEIEEAHQAGEKVEQGMAYLVEKACEALYRHLASQQHRDE